MNPQTPNTSQQARQQIEEDLELISTLSYLLIQTAMVGDDKVTMSTPVLKHVGELIQGCGVRVDEVLGKV